MFTKSFWKDLAERAVTTGVQFLAGFWLLDQVKIINVFELDWNNALGVFLGGVLVSVVKSFAAAPFGNEGTASFTTAVEPAPGRHTA